MSSPNVRDQCKLGPTLTELRSQRTLDRVNTAAAQGHRTEEPLAAPAGFTESEWNALGAHTCPRTNPGCKCRVHYGASSDPYLTSLRIIPTPPEPTINRHPARQPWEPRPVRRQYRNAA